jgi:hypothetical protein
MKRWTNGLPGATKRLGAMMALRGLSPSESRMRADTHDGPEQIAPLQRPDTLMQLSRSLILEVRLVPHGRAIHFGTSRQFVAMRQFGRYWRQSPRDTPSRGRSARPDSHNDTLRNSRCHVRYASTNGDRAFTRQVPRLLARLDWRPSRAPRVGTGAFRRISNELGCACGRCDPPVGGLLDSENCSCPRET